MGVVVASLGAAGGILVALSIKYGDAILKTLATTAAIVLSSILDFSFLGGPLSATMCIAAFQVIVAISNYSFDATPDEPVMSLSSPTSLMAERSTTPLRVVNDDNYPASEDGLGMGKVKKQTL
jgi:Nucleotide-sugar transporter